MFFLLSCQLVGRIAKKPLLWAGGRHNGLSRYPLYLNPNLDLDGLTVERSEIEGKTVQKMPPGVINRILILFAASNACRSQLDLVNQLIDGITAGMHSAGSKYDLTKSQAAFIKSLFVATPLQLKGYLDEGINLHKYHDEFAYFLPKYRRVLLVRVCVFF
jgi:hypothetical protein